MLGCCDQGWNLIGPGPGPLHTDFPAPQPAAPRGGRPPQPAARAPPPGLRPGGRRTLRTPAFGRQTPILRGLLHRVAPNVGHSVGHSPRRTPPASSSAACYRPGDMVTRSMRVTMSPPPEGVVTYLVGDPIRPPVLAPGHEPPEPACAARLLPPAPGPTPADPGAAGRQT